ncbi:MAG: DUF4921 family protein [Brevinematales bacterium]|jgi:galactose-1-phosphate uridylyltransferase
MPYFDKYYQRMPDGTIKQINPYNGTEVWCVEERKRGPILNAVPRNPVPLRVSIPENYCDFCCSKYELCTPEKARVVREADGKWRKYYRVESEKPGGCSADFRLVGNLFEIVTYDYWAKNYHYKMNKTNRDWKEKYLSSPKGYNHAMKMLEIKLNRMGADFSSMPEDEKIEKLNPFFGGSHDLIIGKRHYREGAKFTHELCSSGEMTVEEHFQYILFTAESVKDLFDQNHFIRYIIVFQNWLRPAGASFDHLHKQLVGLDEWGVQMEREMAELNRNQNLYNEFSINFGIYHSMILAENDYAIAVTEIGHRFPTVVVYSKSETSRPFEQTREEIKGMSDLVHAVHCVTTSQTTCNEEWYYSPFDSVYSMPWRICIKLRIHTPAGFEGNTEIYINPVHPRKLASELAKLLEIKRDEGLICPDIRIGGEVKREPNVLKYYKNKLKRL